MCWFAWWSFSDKEILQNISWSLKKRALWNEVFYTDDWVSYYHAPLKLTDLHLNTDQPFSDNNILVWFVWEIYNKSYLLNYIGLSKETDISEIELIAKLYKKLWTWFASLLNGEFVIFIYDKVRGKHFLFRDRYGVHSVYYTVKDSVLYFSSHLQDLFHIHSQDQDENNISWILDYYIFWFSISPNTFIPNIKVLEPWTYFEFDNWEYKTFPFTPYIIQNETSSLIEGIEDAVKKRIPKQHKRIFMPISWWADSNLVLYFLQKYFKGEIICYTFSNENNQRDVEVATKNVKKYGLEHKIIEVPYLEKLDYLKNITEHEWLVNLYNMSWKLRELYPEYDDVHIEFSWDGREELLQVNNHFDHASIEKRYAYIKQQWLGKDYEINNAFLNTSMFDFNLQLIEKLTLWNLIERRLPFTDYDLLSFTWYKNYSQEVKEFLTLQWIQIVDWIYGHNTGVSFKYLYNVTEILDYIKVFQSRLNPSK